MAIDPCADFGLLSYLLLCFPLPFLPLCSFHFREQCHKCGVPKSDAAEVAPGVPQASQAGYGYGGGYGAPVPGAQPGMQVKPGDWQCPSCTNIK